MRIQYDGATVAMINGGLTLASRRAARRAAERIIAALVTGGLDSIAIEPRSEGA
jgi:hypothetical protein